MQINPEKIPQRTIPTPQDQPKPNAVTHTNNKIYMLDNIEPTVTNAFPHLASIVKVETKMK